MCVCVLMLVGSLVGTRDASRLLATRYHEWVETEVVREEKQ